MSKDYRRNGIGTGLLKQISAEKDTDCSIYMDQLDHRAFMESHGFVKKNEVSQMRELNKKRFRESVALYQKKTALRNAFMNYTGDKCDNEKNWNYG